jgi:hypothetical protein
MPMLRSCTFPDCETLTLSPYCVEHEQLVDRLEADRLAQATVTDEPMARELAVQPAPAA